MSNACQENMGQVSAWRTAPTINDGTLSTKAGEVTGIRPPTCVSEMDNKDLRRALRKLELSDMSPLDAYNLWLRDYIMQGGVPTRYYDEPFEERHCNSPLYCWGGAKCYLSTYANITLYAIVNM